MCKWDPYCTLLGAKCCYAEKKWQSCPGLTKRKKNTKPLFSSKAPENQKHHLGFFFSFFFFLAAHMACGILVLCPGIEPVLPAVEAQSLSHWNTREFPWFFKFSQKLPQRCSVQSLSRVQLFLTPWAVARQASLSITNSWSLLKVMSIELMMSSNHLILSSPYPPAFNLC